MTEVIFAKDDFTLYVRNTVIDPQHALLGLCVCVSVTTILPPPQAIYKAANGQ